MVQVQYADVISFCPSLMLRCGWRPVSAKIGDGIDFFSGLNALVQPDGGHEHRLQPLFGVALRGGSRARAKCLPREEYSHLHSITTNHNEVNVTSARVNVTSASERNERT
eukprot:668950-Prorocentrum_minimum.AAC.1